MTKAFADYNIRVFGAPRPGCLLDSFGWRDL